MSSYKITDKLNVGSADGVTPGGISVTDGLGGVVTLKAAAATTNYTLTLPPDTGNATEVLTENTGTGDTIWAPPPSPIFSMWTIQYKLPAGSNPVPAGPTAVNTWEARELNTIFSSPGAGATVTLPSSTTVLLQQGVFWIEGYSSTYKTLRVNSRLRNITTNSIISRGTGTECNIVEFGTNDMMSYSIVKTIYTVTGAAETIELQQRYESIGSGVVYGTASNVGAEEVYVVLNIQLVG